MRPSFRMSLILTLALGTLAAAPREDGTLRLALPEESGSPISLAFSHDGRTLACGTASRAKGGGETGRPSTSGEVFLWDAEDGALLARLSGHESSVDCLAWSGNGEVLCSASTDDGLIIAWDVREARERTRIEIDGKIRNRIGSRPILQVSPDGMIVFAVVERGKGAPEVPERSGSVLAAWELEKGASLWSVPGDGVNAVAVSPNGKALATLGRRIEPGRREEPGRPWSFLLGSPQIEIRETRTGGIRSSLALQGGGYAEIISFSRGGRGLVGISGGGVEVYDLVTGERVIDRSWHHGGGVRWSSKDRFAFSPRPAAVVRGVALERKTGVRLHFDLLELGKGRIVAEADVPRGGGDFALSPTLDHYAIHRQAWGSREILLGTIPWRR